MTRINRIQLSAVVGTALLSAASAHAQITFLTNYNGREYWLNQTPTIYTTARTTAQAFAPGTSFLFSINDVAEETAITAALRGFYGNTQGPVTWIGLTNEFAPGNASGWTDPGNTWADGSPVTYTNWGGGGIPLDDPARIFASYNWNTVPVWIPLEDNGAPASGAGNPAFKVSIIEVVPAPSSAALLALGGLAAIRRRR
jgi:hypothetical protein